MREQTERELLREAERIAEERDRQVAQGEAGSYIEYLHRREQWLRRLATDAPIDEV
jgi:hypothetical protein